MSDRMPEDLPVTKCINVMVGITRSKVFFFSPGHGAATSGPEFFSQVLLPVSYPYSWCQLCHGLQFLSWRRVRDPPLGQAKKSNDGSPRIQPK